MALTFQGFKDELRAEIKRGTSYDARMDGLIRRGARWIEQNYTFQYMRKRIRVDSQVGDETIPLPTNVPLKSLEFLRFIAADGTVLVCTKGELSDPEEQWGPLGRYDPWPVAQTQFPSRFYLDGVTHAVFNRTFQEALAGEGIMSIYSDLPLSPDQSHWLLNNAEGLLLRQCMVEFMTSERDDRGMAALVQKRQEDCKALIMADASVRYTGQDLGLAL